MKDLTLLGSQKKELFDRIVLSKMEPTEFREIRISSRYIGEAEITAIEHKPSEFYFCFDQREGLFELECSPGGDRRILETGRARWSEAFAVFGFWLNYLNREINTVDPWAAIANEPNIVKFSDLDDDNSKFEEEELNQIRQGIGEINDYLQNVLKIDVDIVNSRLSYLESAASRLGRKDWKIILLGVLTNIVTNAYATPEVTREIFTFAAAALKTILVSPHLLM